MSELPELWREVLAYATAVTIAPEPVPTAPVPSRLGGWVRRLDEVGRVRFALGALILFLLGAWAAYGVMWPGDPHRNLGGDPLDAAWFLGWVPWAIAHGHNPFYTNWMYYPSGMNLASQILMPLLGILGAPVTWAFGPLATSNLLFWLSCPLSALSAFLVTRALSRSNVAALVAGTLYGFSPYMVGQSLGHLNLLFVPLPPVFFYLCFQIVVVQRVRVQRVGALAGLVLSAQFLISDEIAATSAVMAVLGVILLALCERSHVTRERARYVSIAALWALGVAGVLLAYPLAVQLFGHLHLTAPVHGSLTTDPYVADALSAVVPNGLVHFAPSQWVAVGNRFTGGGLSEAGGYLGVPLLVLVAYCVWRFRRRRAVLVSAGTALIAEVLSLGPTLIVDGHNTHVPLPWDVLGRLPLMVDVLPARFSLYVALFVGVTLALSITYLRDEAPSSSITIGGARHTVDRLVVARRAAAGTLIMAAVVSLVPNWPVPSVANSRSTPAFFTSRAANEIATNAVVLTYPLGVFPAVSSMLWQITDNYRWKTIGGYGFIPDGPGSTIAIPPSQSPRPVYLFLVDWTVSATNHNVFGPPPAVDATLVAQFRVYLRHDSVSDVVLDPRAPGAAHALMLFRLTLGAPRAVGGVDLWTRVPNRVRQSAGAPPPA